MRESHSIRLLDWHANRGSIYLHMTQHLFNRGLIESFNIITVEEYAEKDWVSA